MSALPDQWIPYARDDGEVIGWIDMTSQAPDLIPIDRLGRPHPTVTDWTDAEDVLDARGLRFLMNTFRYDGRDVRIRQLYDETIVVSTATSDAIGDVGEEYVLPFPPGPLLTDSPGRGDEPVRRTSED